jgi:hypothetical protein
VKALEIAEKEIAAAAAYAESDARWHPAPPSLTNGVWTHRLSRFLPITFDRGVTSVRFVLNGSSANFSCSFDIPNFPFTPRHPRRACC